MLMMTLVCGPMLLEHLELLSCRSVLLQLHSMYPSISCRSREEVLPFCSASVWLHWSTGSSSGFPCTIEMWTCRRAVKGLEHLSCEEAQGDVSCLCKHLKGDYSENRAGLSAVVPRARTRGRGQKPEHGRLPLNTCSSTLVLCRWQSAGMDCPERLWALLLRDLQKHLGTVLWLYLLEQGLGWMDPEVSALLRPAVIL